MRRTLSLSLSALAFAATLQLNGAPLVGVFPSQTIAVEQPKFVKLGDVNNDGRPDLIIVNFDAEQDRSLRIYLNRGGVFNVEPDQTIHLPRAGYLTVGDFDEDGKNDIAVPTGKRFTILWGKDNFTPEKWVIPNVNLRGSARIESAPLSRQNPPYTHDFLIGPVWIKVNARGKCPSGYLRGPEKMDNGYLSSIADIDRDGYPDIVALGGDRGSQELRLYYGPFSNMVVTPSELKEFRVLKTGETSNFAIGDLNDDGRPDLAVGTSNPKAGVRLYFQEAPLGFTENASPSARINSAYGRVKICDINRDGLMDLAVYNYSEILLFLQKQNRPFPERASDADQTIKTRADALEINDLNGDGHPALVVLDVGGKAVKIFNQRPSAQP